MSEQPFVESKLVGFHTAFELSDTPADAEQRQSGEHRVLIFLLEE